MVAKKPKISVIVPTLNEEKRLARCLSSLRDQTYPKDKFEIIVIDHHSHDQTVEIAKKFGAQVFLESEPGIAKARQRGFAEAKGEIVVSLDADNIADKNWLAQIDQEFKKDPKLVSLIGFFSSLEGGLVDRFLLFLGSLSNILSFYFTHTIIIVGINQATRKATLKAIGAFEPVDLPKIHCDIFDKSDLVKRLKKAGKVKFERGVKILFSMRRFHEFGYFGTFWFGLKSWLIHRGFVFKNLAIGYPRGKPQRGILVFVDSLIFFLFIIILTILSLPFIPILMLILGARNTLIPDFSFQDSYKDFTRSTFRLFAQTHDFVTKPYAKTILFVGFSLATALTVLSLVLVYGKGEFPETLRSKIKEVRTQITEQSTPILKNLR